jgi:uncharacterized protein GlcG (DUF336 family)
MMRITSTVVLTAMFAGMSFVAHGQLTERNISLQLAMTIAQAAIAACKKEGIDTSAAVVDRAGDLKVLLRSDAANPHNAELARRKAYTARTYGVDTMAFRDRTAHGSELEGQRELTDIIPLGGGVPILIGAERIGGLGLSGAPTQEDDDRCAKAALASVASQLK